MNKKEKQADLGKPLFENIKEVLPEKKRRKRHKIEGDIVLMQRFQDIEGSFFSIHQLKRFQNQWARDGLIR